MAITKRCVLGISPGTRIIGIAIIQDGELVEWKVRTFRERWSSEKRKAMLGAIRQLCEYYSVGMIAVKKVDPLRSSPEHDRLVRDFTQQAKRYGIKVRHFSLSELDIATPGHKRKTKRVIAEKVAEMHPEVRHEYIKERNNRKEYYIKMFEAIAIAENWKIE